MNRRNFVKLLGALPFLPSSVPKAVAAPIIATKVIPSPYLGSAYVPEIWSVHYAKMLEKRMDREILEGLCEHPPAPSRNDRVVIKTMPKVTFSLRS